MKSFVGNYFEVVTINLDIKATTFRRVSGNPSDDVLVV